MSNGLFYFSSDASFTATPISPVYFDGAPETLTAAAPACSLEKYLTILDATSNGVAATLAAGHVHGQMKRVLAKVVSGGATTLTLANAVSTSLDVVTFTVVGDCVDLIWNEEAGYWRVLALIDVDRNISTPTVA